MSTSSDSASLEWKDRDGYTNTTGNLKYFITIWPSLVDQGVSSFNTTNTSLLLNLSYDQEYHMRMIASNCIGNSTPINISIGEYHNFHVNLSNGQLSVQVDVPSLQGQIPPLKLSIVEVLLETKLTSPVISTMQLVGIILIIRPQTLVLLTSQLSFAQMVY